MKNEENIESVQQGVSQAQEFAKSTSLEDIKSGAKAKEAREAVELSNKYRIGETPTLIIAGNIKTDPHAMDHDLNLFMNNALAIIASILR